MDILTSTIKDNLPAIKALRHKLHENAELSFNEYKTQKIILDFCKGLRLKTDSVFKTGVTALLNNDTNCIGIRADMDALPVNGVSHACGHDFHMAIVLGTALVLKRINYDKCIKFIFQPGEESDGGALPMIKQGVLSSPSVIEMISLHIWPGLKTGSIEVSPGASMASVDDFYIYFRGISGHAAIPEMCSNPLLPAVEFIHTMKNNFKFVQDPLAETLISFSCIHCGNVPNIIADEAVVSGTVRTFDNKVRDEIYKVMSELSKLNAKTFGCTSEINYDFQYPPLINDTKVTDNFINISKDLLGKENVKGIKKTYTGDDFAFFAEKVPSVHFRLGIEGNGKGFHPLHSQFFDADEECLYYGILLLTNYILKRS